MTLRSKKILAHARGQNCSLRLDGCNHNPETVVFCHLNLGAAGKGMSVKAHDCLGFFGCTSCHTAYDSQQGRSGLSADVLRAVCETWAILIRDGIIVIPEDKPKARTVKPRSRKTSGRLSPHQPNQTGRNASCGRGTICGRKRYDRLYRPH